MLSYYSIVAFGLEYSLINPSALSLRLLFWLLMPLLQALLLFVTVNDDSSECYECKSETEASLGRFGSDSAGAHPATAHAGAQQPPAPQKHGNPLRRRIGGVARIP